MIVAAITSKSKVKMPTHVLINETKELEKDSVVLLEQLRTVDKQRLEDYVCTLDKKTMKRIDKALRSSTGVSKEEEKPLELCLCSVCAGHFYNVPDYYIRRVNQGQTEKETCMFCNSRKGYDYYIGRKKR